MDTGIRELLTEMRQGKSDRLQKYFEFSARFHRYSVHNQFLIYLQCPQATFVAGYRKWQELGYQVGKGEKGIRILAPRLAEKVDPETQDPKPVLYFVPVSVFDASQLTNTSEKPLALFFTPLADDQTELYSRLVHVVQNSGIRIEESPLGLTQGASMRRRIAIRGGMDSRTKFLTLLHEYINELFHRQLETETARQSQRMSCESGVVCCGTPFRNSEPFGTDYLQHGGNTPKELYEELEIVRKTSALIIQQLEEPNVEIGLVDGEMVEDDNLLRTSLVYGLE